MSCTVCLIGQMVLSRIQVLDNKTSVIITCASWLCFEVALIYAIIPRLWKLKGKRWKDINQPVRCWLICISSGIGEGLFTAAYSIECKFEDVKLLEFDDKLSYCAVFGVLAEFSLLIALQVVLSAIFYRYRRIFLILRGTQRYKFLSFVQYALTFLCVFYVFSSCLEYIWFRVAPELAAALKISTYSGISKIITALLVAICDLICSIRMINEVQRTSSDIKKAPKELLQSFRFRLLMFLSIMILLDLYAVVDALVLNTLWKLEASIHGILTLYFLKFLKRCITQLQTYQEIASYKDTTRESIPDRTSYQVSDKSASRSMKQNQAY